MFFRRHRAVALDIPRLPPAPDAAPAFLFLGAAATAGAAAAVAADALLPLEDDILEARDGLRPAVARCSLGGGRLFRAGGGTGGGGVDS